MTKQWADLAMPSFLKNHPFAVKAHFESSTILTFAVPKEKIEGLIPECLTLDIVKDKWAFIAVALVQTKNLRPNGFPKIFGNSFFLVEYRIFVRYTNEVGEEMRGLYVIKSETDKRKMQFLGNIFTHYNYTTTDIEYSNRRAKMTVESTKSDFKIVVDQTDGDIPLPDNSPFDNWGEARKFAAPLTFKFTYDPTNKKVLIIEGVRKNWLPKPVKVLEHSFSFLASLHLEDAILANAFTIKNIPYFWKKGVIEQWRNWAT